MNTVIEVLACLAAIWFCLKLFHLYLVARNEILTEKILQMTEKIKSNIIQVDIEKHNDIFYLYEKDTGEFIAQGSNFEEVKQRCESRFKGKSVVADEIQIEQLGLK